MSKSSIHFSPVKANSEVHNLRKVDLDYNFKELESKNESFVGATIQERSDEQQKLCKELSGRKMQKNATPIREAVVNIKPKTTMYDLAKLSAELHRKFKIDCFQIHIHRDEGKSINELNHHAHMVFDWQDKQSGKMLRHNKAVMSQIQTLAAKELNMERGELKENSNRERLEAVEYKVSRETEKLEMLQVQIENLEQKKNRAISRDGQAREEYNKLRIELEEINGRDREAEAERSRHKQRIEQLATKGVALDKKSLKQEGDYLSGAIEWQREEIERSEREYEEHFGEFKRVLARIETIRKSSELYQARREDNEIARLEKHIRSRPRFK